MAVQSVNLQLINQSEEKNHSEVLIFQKNVATGFSELAVAWRVIQNLGQGDRHPFTYSTTLQVDAGDSWGNYTPQFTVAPGQAYQMSYARSGDQFLPYPPGAAAPTDIDVLNNLPQGAISCNIYRSGRLVATKTAVAPGQKATFEFKPTIFIGVASEITEGQFLDSAVLSQVNTEIFLLGLKSADIIMTGGGPGSDSKPFQFTLANQVYL